MHYGSQANVSFLQHVIGIAKYFDVIVDDGGHVMQQQITSIKTLIPAVRSGGLYIIEDLLTSYMSGYHGKYLDPSTIISFIKNLVDDIQTASPIRTVTSIGKYVRSFELENEICLFNIK
ncbi:unnamed protein product [Didymodactylos carnosus]|uniref:Uncharacterized protein n=1 Tax=Didymodactylos carnosus TaxID=1234261 RepID=A0A815T3T6_9BILA|nr:unnamed protein product [Didymodactylos carnosus]CAF1496084.1 unnamed protein product [Didymodactylos carnosus]CAF3575485.1 unnamed protein product [Didymodactylos carnosus]CAF4358521.1 unnamed protein product [Didymodactylos carnosus]